MHDKKELQIFFVVKMVKKEIGSDISMQIAKCLKLYIYIMYIYYNTYIKQYTLVMVLGTTPIQPEKWIECNLSLGFFSIIFDDFLKFRNAFGALYINK